MLNTEKTINRRKYFKLIIVVIFSLIENKLINKIDKIKIKVSIRTNKNFLEELFNKLLIFNYFCY